MIVEKRKHRGKQPARPEQELQRQLVIALKAMLTPATFLSISRHNTDQADPDEPAIRLPRLTFIHNGRAFYLELQAPRGTLTPLQRALHVALRDAGARVEVARSVPEALGHIRSFGIPLRDISIRTVFRGAA